MVTNVLPVVSHGHGYVLSLKSLKCDSSGTFLVDI